MNWQQRLAKYKQQQRALRQVTEARDADNDAPFWGGRQIKTFTVADSNVWMNKLSKQTEQPVLRGNIQSKVS